MKEERNTNHIFGQTDYNFTIIRLNSATNYNVWISALNSGGEGRFTAYKTITTGEIITLRTAL